ncbi:hypothetical protein [Arthrobacter sp. UYEF21]|uniref:hypothetical protein n=1 Tax=Arthrobacter sp. UYEF21 TaxID=1756364 RepID=UPI00339472D2
MAVTIITTDGTFNFPDTKPEEVHQTGPVVKVVNSKGQPIGHFRRVQAWFETPADEGRA